MSQIKLQIGHGHGHLIGLSSCAQPPRTWASLVSPDHGQANKCHQVSSSLIRPSRVRAKSGPEEALHELKPCHSSAPVKSSLRKQAAGECMHWLAPHRTAAQRIASHRIQRIASHSTHHIAPASKSLVILIDHDVPPPPLQPSPLFQPTFFLSLSATPMSATSIIGSRLPFPRRTKATTARTDRS